ncbi:MAG: AcrR family transcriptional regulator, partial [Ascidiaceihabitans sp.]
MSNRLTKEKWVQHGLETLEKSGFGALNAEPLAKALKVSRGSFYWHFNDIDVFRKAVLELWR